MVCAAQKGILFNCLLTDRYFAVNILPHDIGEGGMDAGILYEVQEESGDQEPAADKDEERAAGNQWCLSQLRDQGVPNRQIIDSLIAG